MSTEIEFTDPNDSETDEAVDTFEESEIADPFAIDALADGTQEADDPHATSSEEDNTASMSITLVSPFLAARLGSCGFRTGPQML